MINVMLFQLCPENIQQTYRQYICTHFSYMTFVATNLVLYSGLDWIGFTRLMFVCLKLLVYSFFFQTPTQN